jgi:hypothetical protein
MMVGMIIHWCAGKSGRQQFRAAHCPLGPGVAPRPQFQKGHNP